MTRRVRAFMAMMMAAAVAACSGGGDEPTGPQQPPPPPPPPAAVASVELTPANAGLYAGRTMTLQATLKDANGNTLTNRAITWASSAEGTVSVNAQGVITGLAVDDAAATGTSEWKSAQSGGSVSLVCGARVSIRIAKTFHQLGGTVALPGIKWDARDEHLLGRSITWSSNKPNLASV